ncbi:WW domain binding protein 4 [Coemansia sp. RSA 1939]|nr:WW domain binding protein 4 [Coemansia sp. RSA 1939]KAJ2682201.1 WW domain binding protein 4 [Coemansia sp. RSA 1285]
MSSASHQRKAPWDRNNKYWCQYCRIYVFDNRSSRSIHESGTKHKANVQKYLRQISKDTEAKKHEEQRLASQLEKIEKAAEASYREEMNDVAYSNMPFTEPAASIDHSENNTEMSVHNVVDDADNTGKPSQEGRPADVGVVGAWEVVEDDNADEDDVAGGDGNGEGYNKEGHSQMPLASAGSNSTRGTGAGAGADRRPPDGQSSLDLRGAELLDDEDHDHGYKLTDFDIKEKVIGDTFTGGRSADIPNVDARQNNGTDESAEASKGLFKKRRAAGNRTSSRKQQKKS